MHGSRRTLYNRPRNKYHRQAAQYNGGNWPHLLWVINDGKIDGAVRQTSTMHTNEVSFRTLFFWHCSYDGTRVLDSILLSLDDNP